MPKDLRSFLRELQENHGEEVVEIEREISSKWEVTALQVKLEKQGKFPVLISSKPLNVFGVPAHYRLIGNVLASRRRCAEAIGVSPVEVAREYLRKAGKKSRPSRSPARKRRSKRSFIPEPRWTCTNFRSFGITPWMRAPTSQRDFSLPWSPSLGFITARCSVVG